MQTTINITWDTPEAAVEILKKLINPPGLMNQSGAVPGGFYTVKTSNTSEEFDRKQIAFIAEAYRAAKQQTNFTPLESLLEESDPVFNTEAPEDFIDAGNGLGVMFPPRNA